MSDGEREREIGMTRDAEASCVRRKSEMGEGRTRGERDGKEGEEKKVVEKGEEKIYGKKKGRSVLSSLKHQNCIS